jgi:hypothetical protein
MITTAQMMLDGRALCTVSIEGGTVRSAVQAAVGRLIHTATQEHDMTWDHIEIYVNRWENGRPSDT